MPKGDPFDSIDVAMPGGVARAVGGSGGQLEALEGRRDGAGARRRHRAAGRGRDGRRHAAPAVMHASKVNRAGAWWPLG